MLSRLAQNRIAIQLKIQLSFDCGRCKPQSIGQVIDCENLRCFHSQPPRPRPQWGPFRHCPSSVLPYQAHDQDKDGVAFADAARTRLASTRKRHSTGTTRVTDSEQRQCQSTEETSNRIFQKPHWHKQSSTTYNDHSTSPDAQSWAKKFYDHRRLFGEKGARHVWNEFKRVEIQNAPSLFEQQQFLRGLMVMGFRDNSFLEDLCRYLRRSYEVKRDSPPRSFELYKTVLGHVLQTSPAAASTYHAYLKCFPPNRHDVLELSISSAGNEEASKAFKRLCLDYDFFRDLYDLVVPSLCREELYDDAYGWHLFIIGHGDNPSDPANAELLSRHFANSGQHQKSKKIMQDINADNRSVFSRLPSSDRGKYEFQTMLHEMEEGSPLSKFPARSFSDEFCARLFATRFFSIETIIKGLQVLQAREIGPLSLREILLRVAEDEQCDTEVVSTLFDILSGTGISLGESLFSRLVQKIAKEGNSALLYDVAVCDQHPDVLEDWVLQETLLAQYESDGNTRQVQRTLAVLLMDTGQSFDATKMMNVLLRSALSRGNDNDMMRILEAMRQRDLLISARSLSWMYKKLVPQRLERKLPVMKNLKRLTSVWQHLMVSGTEIPPKSWDDVLRTLLMQGSLHDYEALSLWLARWFTDSKYRDSATNRLTQSRTPQANSSLRLDLDLEALFNQQVFHEVVLWGFYHGSNSKSSEKYPSGSSLKERAEFLSNHPAFWGLHHMLRLKTNGINIPDQITRRVCQQRLRSIFSEGFRTKNVNRRTQRYRLGTMEEYIVAMEMIWGPKLFLRSVSVREFGRGMLRGANHHWRYRMGRLENWLDRTGKPRTHSKDTQRPYPVKRRQ